MSLRSLVVKTFLIALTALALPSLAAYPDKPVKLLVGYGPGGATDIIARLLSKYLKQKPIPIRKGLCLFIIRKRLLSHQ